MKNQDNHPIQRPLKNRVRSFQTTKHQDTLVAFNCIFTEEIRRLLKIKRNSLGLTYQKLAEFFGINWSTLRKWENGPTETCEMIHRFKVQNFINGGYDQEIISMISSQTGGYSPYSDDEIIKQCMERMTNTYELCSSQPKIQRQMLESLESVTRKAIEELIAADALDTLTE